MKIDCVEMDFLKSAETVEVLDVGASAIGENPIYMTLFDNELAHLNLFDGDARQIPGIAQKYSGNVAIYDQYLFDGLPQKVYLASSESGMTSILKPSSKALSLFNGFTGFGEINEIVEIQTQKLDDIKDLPEIDFIKMDIQGAELTVLKNGLTKIRNAVAIQLEVSFICLYEDQPTFGEIDVWMRQNGFVPHTYLYVKRWSLSPTIFLNNFRIPGNQLLEADIVYIKDPLELSSFSDQQLFKLAAIAHHSLKSFDLSGLIILELQKRKLIDQNSYLTYLSTTIK